mgnify:CR=1 FL=1
MVEEARDRWVEVEEKYESLRVRAQPGYVVIVSEWASRDEALTSEVVDALTRPLSSVDELLVAWRAVARYSRVELEACSDGVLRIPHGWLRWFHGQDWVNRLLERYGARLAEDYDGVTRAEAVVGRPVTSEGLDRGIRVISFLLKLYGVIERVQASEALKATLSMLRELEEIVGGEGVS